MKTNLATLTFLLFFTFPILANPAPDNTLSVGEVSIPVLFEDPSLTDYARNFFSNELESFFSYSTNIVDSFPEDWAEHGFRNYYFPQFVHTETDFDRGLGYTNSPTQQLHVFRRFTNRYRLDGVAYSTYTNLHASAVQFISMLNTGSVTNLSTTAKINLFLFLPATPPTWNESNADMNLVELVNGNTFFPPSYFDFRLENPVPPFSAPIPILMLKGQKTGSTKIFAMPVIYANGMWRFLDIVE